MSRPMSQRIGHATRAIIQAVLFIPMAGAGGALVGYLVGLVLGGHSELVKYGCFGSMILACFMAPQAMDPAGPGAFLAWFLSGLFALQVSAGVGVAVAVWTHRLFGGHDSAFIAWPAGIGAAGCTAALLGILFGEPIDTSDRSLRGEPLTTFEEVKNRAGSVLRNLRRGPGRGKAQFIWHEAWDQAERQHRAARGKFYD